MFYFEGFKFSQRSKEIPIVSFFSSYNKKQIDTFIPRPFIWAMYQSVEDGVEAAFGCETGPRLFCSTKTRPFRYVPLLLALCLFSMQI